MATQISGELRDYDPSNNESKPSTAFVDLASFDNIERAMYGGKRAITYFMRETTRSTWFTQMPVRLQNDEVDPDFDQSFSVTVSREGDYLLNAWLRVSLGALSIYNPTNGWINTPTQGRETIGWTPNFMHNLVERCTLKVNGLIVDELYSEHLDFLSAFTVPKGSRIGYNRMIGNFNTPFQGLSPVNVSGYMANKYPNVNWQQELFLPLPFFFSRGTTSALPLVSLPYNDIKIEFKFRDWRKLLYSVDADGQILTVNASQVMQQTPKIENVQVWGNYAVITDSERKKVGCYEREMTIEQNKQLGGSYGSGMLNTDTLKSTTKVDLRFSGAVKTLFFSARNSSGSSDLPYRSNYTTAGPSASDVTVCKLSISGVTEIGNFENGLTLSNSTNVSGVPPLDVELNPFNIGHNDRSGLVWPTNPTNPIGTARLMYENNLRFDMESLYYSLIQPHQHARNVPESSSLKGIMSLTTPNEVSGQPALSVGYNMYSYALKVKSRYPSGSSNYNDLSNVNLVFTPSTSAINNKKNGHGPWTLFVSAITQNVIKISKGVMTFPII